MDKKINIYAPCDGFVNKISDLNDGVFSEKMLGDGLYIEPTSNTFYSPINDGWLENIFETKHAFHFKHNDGLIALMHIGLDTVNLKGNGFKLLHNSKEKVSNKTKIVEVDLDLIKKNNIKTNTPIVFEFDKNDYQINLTKLGKVKQGDIIAELNLVIKQKANDLLSNLDFKNKYEKAAEDIYKFVGTNINIKKAYNCMTRFRLIVKDKSLVNDNDIKKINIVKGINWNGEELQIIIGGDSYKVREAYQNLVDKTSKNNIKNKSTKKRSFKQKTLGFISGIIIPVLPIMITAGLLKALQSILEQLNAIAKVSISMNAGGISKLLTDYDLGSALVFSIANIGLAFLGVAFVVSTVNYFKGNIYIAIFIGITLMNPYLTGGLNWELFKLGDVSIKVQSYASSIIPMVAAGVLYIYLDKFIKLWMPSTVDIIFRPFLAYLLTVLPIIFILGPVLGILESGIYYIMTWIGEVPYGIGAGLFAFTWQFLVITGLHTAINGFVNMSIANNQPTVLGLCFTITVFSQMGAGIGMLIRTKNSNSKKTIFAAIPATWFGITEPILYGSTLPKFRPFLMGCVGAGIGGLFIGLTPATSYTVSAGGIFAILRVVEGGWLQMGLYVLSWIVTIVSSMLLTILFYKERNSELSEIKKVNNLVYKIYSNWSNLPLKESKEKLNKNIIKLNNFIDDNFKNLIKNFDNSLKETQKLEVYLKNIDERLENKKAFIIKRAINLQNKGKIEKIKLLNEKFKILDYSEKTVEKKKKLYTLLLDRKKLENEVEKKQDEFLKLSNTILLNISNEIKHPYILNLNSAYFNAVHSCDINYMLTEKQDIETKYSFYKKTI
ncbi:PTS system, sucrose-specific IIB component [Spiroplasma litorale]|uniref:PTS system, sucrose-specific IIB component n=1 Tax=Spiroplasma litorale TaxID=216942 RepID=A0A0K1W2B6_9MOLU|nr:glucose PTS transporter subunit IIA [Spiroplasma litorale]AKX34242.1 PTS system, sucrose-specific IIB component [Spiroplasma litorale]